MALRSSPRRHRLDRLPSTEEKLTQEDEHGPPSFPRFLFFLFFGRLETFGADDETDLEATEYISAVVSAELFRPGCERGE